MSLKAIWSKQTAPKLAPTARTIKVAAAPQSVKVALLEEFGGNNYEPSRRPQISR